MDIEQKYIKINKDWSVEYVEHILDMFVVLGAKPREWINGGSKHKDKYLVDHKRWKYVGVNRFGNIYFSCEIKKYGNGAEEITVDQLKSLVREQEESETNPEFNSAGIDTGSKSHPYANMIKAKAENMDLVVMFYNTDIGEWEEREWYEIDVVFPSFSKGTDYFLCLPKHKAAVLHSLNGGDVGIIVDGRSSLAYTGSTWCAGCWYMDESCESRIKQEEAKRHPKEGELWMCEYRGYERALFRTSGGWCSS